MTQSVSSSLTASRSSVIPSSRKADLFDTDVEQAEGILLELVDFLYANSSLKPMSKMIFTISRLLLTLHETEGSGEQLEEIPSIERAYEGARDTLGDQAPPDDFSFSSVMTESETFLPRMLSDLRAVLRLTRGRDTLGLVFETLVRGKWETGEGLGTFLTPEEIVEPMVTMALTRNRALARIEEGSPGGEAFFGDICGGTGRFVHTLSQELMRRGMGKEELSSWLWLFDQSSFAIGLARLNLYFSGLRPNCIQVSDSLTAPSVSALKGLFASLATNPPFGASKYSASPELREALPRRVVRQFETNGTSFDPAALFAIRNIDLLCSGGILAIVLPDGVIQSSRFLAALHAYEEERECQLAIRALVSLPTVTFSLAGTVAKTSFLIIEKDPQTAGDPMFHAMAQHVGFLRSANQRIPDPKGNDLVGLAEEYQAGFASDSERWTANWREWGRLGLRRRAESRLSPDGFTLGSLADPVREYTSLDLTSEEELHIAVTDVDETGLLDIIAATRNRPLSRVLECKPGDVLISCINPRIWRVIVVPDLSFRWTCSPEFVVLRPKDGVNAWEIYVRLHHQDIIRQVQRMAGGTSSSRQRVPKDEIVDFVVPEVHFAPSALEKHRKARESIYRTRLREVAAYEGLHAGTRSFDLGR